MMAARPLFASYAITIATVCISAAAYAGTCLEQAQQLATEHNLVIDPPNLPPETSPKDVGPGGLGKSGGVVEPPLVDDPAVIKPPDVGSRMPTVPEVAPGPKQAEPDKASPLGATDLALLESVLIAARSEAQRGDEKACFERLEKAREIAGRARR